MKKDILLLLGILIHGSMWANTYLNFEVKEAKNLIIELVVKEKNKQKSQIYRINLKSDNRVSTVIDIQQDAFVEVKHNQEQFLLYMRPNDDVKITYTFNQAINTLKFSGRGAENNQLLSSYKRQFQNSGYWDYEVAYLKTKILQSNYQKATLSPSQYYENLEKEHQKQLTFLAKKKSISALSPTLLEYIAKDIQYTYETQKIGYLIINQKKMRASDFQHIASHYQLKKDANTLSVDLVQHPAYLNYIYAYAHFLHLPRDTHSKAVELDYYNKIEEKMTGRAKYYLLSQLLQNVYIYKGSSYLAEKKFASFKKKCPYPEYSQKVEQLYGNLIIDMPEVMAPDFRVRDEAGNIRSLVSYRGKVVYISFWAHWCKPCIAGFKKSLRLRTKLQKMGVVLMNVSIDKEDSTWKTALAKHNIYGSNFIANNTDDIRSQYGLGSLPAYFIVNKQGKFVYLSDKANRDIIKEFELFLKE